MRLSLALLAGIVAAAVNWALRPEVPGRELIIDFDQSWAAARVLFAGGNPYESIGPGKPYGWPWPYYYPLPAALSAVHVHHVRLERADPWTARGPKCLQLAVARVALDIGC